MSTGLSSPELVGRETEMERLGRVLGAAEEARPTLTLVIGEAGVGKTRLVQELARRAADRGMLVLQGECVELSGGEFPYAPIAAALRVVSPVAIDEALARLPTSARSELARVFPDIVGEPDVPGVEDEQFAQSRVFAWLLSLLRRLGESVPILLAVEDLQLADASSRDFFRFLARSMRSERVGVVATIRGDELHRDHPVRRLVAELAHSQRVDRLDVTPLSMQAIERQVAGILESDPPQELVARLFARAEGNPFYTEELLAADRATTHALPSTLRDALVLRVESRSANAQAIARVVSAVSRPAEHALIQAVAGLSERDTQSALRDCVDHQLFVCDRETGCYRFRHALLREAVYDDLLSSEREVLHRRIAEALEQARDPVSAAESAYHWDAAGEPERALPALIEAGLASERVFAHGEALAQFGRALELWRAQEPARKCGSLDRVGLLARAAEAARWTGDFARAQRLCEQALASFDHDTNPVRAAELYERLGRYQPWNVESSLAAYEHAMALLPNEDIAQRIRLQINQAYALTFLARWEEAKAKAERALQDALEERLLPEEVSARAVLGVAVAFLGDLPAGERHLRRALQLGEQTRNVEDLAQIYLDLGEVLRLQGRVQDALDVMLDGERLAARHGAGGSYGNFMAVNAADDLLRLGRWDEAEARLTELGSSQLGPTAELLTTTVAGRLDTARGRLDSAGARFERAAELSQEAALLEFIPTFRAAYAELELWRHANDRARAQIAAGLRSIGEGEDVLHLPALYSMGARVEAEMAEQARSCGDAVAAESAYQAAGTYRDRLAALLEVGRSGVRPPEAAAHLASCEAELTRAAGSSSPDRWARVVELWNGLDRPYAAAYGTYRHAEALIFAGSRRSQAQQALAEAERLTASLSAVLLSDAIRALAGAARLRVSTEGRGGDALTKVAGETLRALDLPEQGRGSLLLDDRDDRRNVTSPGVGSLVAGYDELRLRIDRRAQGSYHVHASTRSAEASASLELPFNELEIENFILRVGRPRGRRRIDSSALSDAKRFGGRLFQALFREEIHHVYRDALAEARRRNRGVRITLCLSGSPELIEVPWEYLFDDPDFLAVSAFTPVVRYLDLPRAYRPLRVEPPLRLLGVVSSPSEYEPLDVERERENLRRALSGLSETGVVELQWLERPTLSAMLRALQANTFHGLHYIGHATFDKDADQGVLLLEDDSGWARAVSGEKLGMILHDFTSLRLAVLNACEGGRTARTDPFAGVAGALVQRDIPAVIAMQFEISDEAAIVFAEGFYRAIASGSPVDAAIAAARLAMLAERSDDIEWGTPVLFMRVPDGRIFDFREGPLRG